MPPRHVGQRALGIDRLLEAHLVARLASGAAVDHGEAPSSPAAPKSATIRIPAQGTYTLFINGTAVGTDGDVVTLDQYDITPFLKKGTNNFQVDVKSDFWFSGVFACGTFELADGRKVEFQTDKTWRWSKPGEKHAAQAVEVIRGVNGACWNNVGRLMVMPDAYYRLNTGVDECGINWARPYAGKAPKVLAVHPRAAQRDTVQLVLRTDLPVSAVFSDAYNFNVEHRPAPFFPVTKGMWPSDIEVELQNALAAHPDVVVLGGMGGFKGDDVFYSALADPLKALVANGDGLFYVSGAIPARTVPGQKPMQNRSSEEELTDTAWQSWRLWNSLFLGFSSMWWYSFGPGANEGNIGSGFEPYPTLKTAAGGLLIADIRPGICKDNGKWDEEQTVPHLFGLTFDKALGRKMVQGTIQGTLLGRRVKVDPGQEFPADPAVRLAGAKAVCVIDGAGIERVLKVDVPEGKEWLFGLDTAYFQDGAAQYVGITKKRETDGEPTRQITVHVPKAGHIYDAMSGRYLGRADS